MALEQSPEEQAGRVWAPRWWAVFGIGLLLWIGSVVATYLTSDIILLPTVILLGSFLVPVTAVVWYVDHDPSPVLSPRRIFTAFIVAAVIGVLAASLMEYYLVRRGFFGNIEVGLIEEFVKGALVVIVAIGIRTFHTRDGIALGAAVGFGFAALESSGYALVSLFVVQGHHLFLSLISVVTNELVRGLLSRFAHGMWSAVIGGAVFAAAKRDRRLRLAWSVVIAYLGVALLHAAFDSIGGILGYAIISFVGLVPLVWMWRRGDGHRSVGPA